MRKELVKKGVTDVYVCGLAADVCVGKARMAKLRVPLKSYQNLPTTFKYPKYATQIPNATKRYLIMIYAIDQ